MTGASDLALVRRWTVSRDAAAFSEIVRRHSTMVYATCLRILRNPAEAEDVAQECFIKLATGDVELRSSLGGWLHRVATRHALDRIKIERRRLHRDTAYATSTPAAKEPTWDEISGHVDELIADLPDKYHFAVVSHFLEGQSYDAIAQTLGIPRSTAAYRVHKGVELVRRGLARRGITTAAVTLAALLATHAAEAAVPETLTATLGRLALSGLRRGVPNPPVPRRGKLVWAATGVAALVLSFLVFLGTPLWRTEPPHVPSVAGDAPAELPRVEAPFGFVAADERERLDGSMDGRRAPTGVVAAAEKVAEEEPEAPLLATVTGRVTDNEGNAIPGAMVYVRTARDLLGYGIIKTSETETGPDGSYRLDVPPGLPFMYAHAPGYVMLQSFGRRVEGGRIYSGVDFGLAPSRVQVTGCVVDESGRGLPGATVHLRACGMIEDQCRGIQSSMVDLVFARTDAAGAFVLDLPIEGQTDLTVECDGYAPGHFELIEAPAQDVQLVLRRPGSIAGTVTRVDGTPVPNAAVFAVGLTDTSCKRWDRGQTVSIPASGATTDATGAFRIDGLSEDFTYTVYAGRSEEIREPRQPEDAMLFPPFVYDTSHDFAARNNIRVQAGCNLERVDLVLGAAAVVRGRVTDRSTGKPVVGMLVNCANCRDDIVTQADTTDENGRYALNLCVDRPFEAQLRLCYLSPGGMNVVGDIWERGRVRVSPGDVRVVDFAVDAPVNAPVRVIYRDGSPAQGAGIMARALKHGTLGYGVDSFTDSDGRVTMRGLMPDCEYVIMAGIRHRDGDWTHLTESEPFAGAPGETLPELVLMCDPLGGVTGTVVAPEGYPLWDKLVRFEGANPYTGAACSGDARSNDNGRFTKVLALPEGFYPEIRISLRRGGAPHSAVVRDVTIRRDEMTDLGSIEVFPDPQPAEETPP